MGQGGNLYTRPAQAQARLVAGCPGEEKRLLHAFQECIVQAKCELQTQICDSAATLEEVYHLIKDGIKFHSYSSAWGRLRHMLRGEEYDTSPRASSSQLVRLMTHILKWHTQPTPRSPSWVATINHARQEMLDSQEATPSITDDAIQGMWAQCFQRAK